MPDDGGRSGGPPSDDELVQRMRAGDREAAAVYLLRRRDELERYIKRNMRGDAAPAREDILSTLLRRVDRMVLRGRFAAKDSDAANALVFTIARRAMLTLFRRNRVHRDALEASKPAVRSGPTSARAPNDLVELREVVSGLDAASYDLLVDKLSGADSRAIARKLGISPEAVRQRWKTLKDRLWGTLGGDR